MWTEDQSKPLHFPFASVLSFFSLTPFSPPLLSHPSPLSPVESIGERGIFPRSRSMRRGLGYAHVLALLGGSANPG